MARDAGTWLVASVEQDGAVQEAAGGRPLEMLESREGLVCVSKGECVDIQRSAV